MIVFVTVVGAVAVLASYEFYALFTGKTLVTTYVRDAFRLAPGWFMLASFVTGVLFGHFFVP